MTNLYAQETWINKTEKLCHGDSDIYETYTDDRGELFKNFRKKYGRCTGKIHVDSDSGVLDIGWVFVKRVKYSDCNDTFLQETWVAVHEKEPTKTVKYHYA